MTSLFAKRFAQGCGISLASLAFSWGVQAMDQCSQQQKPIEYAPKPVDTTACTDMGGLKTTEENHEDVTWTTITVVRKWKQQTTYKEGNEDKVVPPCEKIVPDFKSIPENWTSADGSQQQQSQSSKRTMKTGRQISPEQPIETVTTTVCQHEDNNFVIETTVTKKRDVHTYNRFLKEEIRPSSAPLQKKR